MNIKDYIRWRGDISMKQDPFNEVDNLVLTQLSYINWDGIVPETGSITLREASLIHMSQNRKADDDNTPDTLQERRQDLAYLAGESLRFCDLRLIRYVNDTDHEAEKQFAAVSFLLPDRTYYVAFRGTGSDIVGWKEDFNMSYTCPVPAQSAAQQYLKDMASSFRFANFRVGGHSKGGNLAIYAAVMLQQPKRIIAVYNNDGPGFPESFINKKAYRELLPKMKSLLPQKSVVGRLMNNTADVDIVRSSADDLLSQHNVLTWEIDVNKIVREERNTSESQFFQGVFNQWNNQLSLEEKMVFMNAVYDVMLNAGIRTGEEVLRNKLSLVRKMAAHFTGMNEASRNICLDVLGALLRSNFSSFRNTFLEGIIRQEKKGEDLYEDIDS